MRTGSHLAGPLLAGHFASLLVVVASLAFTLHAQPNQSGAALPALVSRAAGSLSALLSASGRQAPQPAGPLQGVQVQPQQQQQQQQQQQPQQVPFLPGPPLMQMGAAGNSSGGLAGSAKYASNVLEALSSVGKAIQQQIMSASSGGAQQAPAGQPGNIQIMTPAGAELANTKKNEYQSIVVNEAQQLNVNQGPGVQQLAGSNANNTNYREQGEQLRQEIVRRAGQLQQVVASSMEVLKSSGDLILRRLLEQMNSRLDQAKSKADKIISEPATNEMAIRALTTINHGLNNLNNIITNIVTRLDLSAKEAQASGGPTQRLAAAQLLEQARLKLNWNQLGQQFTSALNAAQQQQRHQQPARQA